MIFKKLFQPKWQHANPEIRRRGLQRLPSSDPQLQQLARTDQDPGLRRAALGRCNDLDLLRQSAQDDPDAGVRTYAQARLQHLLLGQDGDQPARPALAQRLALLDGFAPAELLETLATQAAEPELRLAALTKLDRETLYAERAVYDSAAQLRAAALAQVHTPELLDRIAKDARNRDKRVSRDARERVQTLRAERQRQDALEELCRGMETLTWEGEHGPSAARFAQLEQSWRALADAAGDAQRERFRRARDRFAEHFKASTAERQARADLCRQLQQQETDLDRRQLLAPQDRQGLAETLARLRADWDALGPAADPENKKLKQ